jgi:hypothetical protein
VSLVTRASDISFDAASAMYAPQRSGLEAGEALDAFACCYIKQSDGKVYMSNATSANEAAGFDGMTVKSYASGDTNITLFGLGTKIRYATGLTPGAIFYIGATAGRFDTAATAGDAVGIARVISATLIRITRDVSGAAVSGAAITAGTLPVSKLATFKSTEQTGTGSAQNIAHSLGGTPGLVIVYPTDTSPATAGAYTMTEGTHDATNCVVTVTTGKKYKVVAFL